MEEKRVARELTSQQRAYLRSLANTLPDILFIGKEGLTEYGFIVALKDSLGETDANDFTHESTFTFVEGKNIDSEYAEYTIELK